MNKIVSVHRFKTSNVGDIYSSPDHYFSWLKTDIKYDIWTDSLKFGELYKDKTLILGGGGLLDNTDFNPMLKKLNKSIFKNKIIWGAGLNHHGIKCLNNLFPFLKNYNLVGIRDYGFTEYNWVPCPSCLDNAFNNEYKIKHKYVIYEHKNNNVGIGKNESLRHINNFKTIKDALEFIGSGEVVVTNTYHGAYWATLLNRKVIIINPFSNKFYGLKHKHIFSNPDNFKNILNKTVSYEYALEECRKANIDFSQKVHELIMQS